MKWNLRLAAASRGIWKPSELQRLLAERGMVVSAGKMSGLWSGQPNTVKLDELDVICAVLGCDVGELLVPDPSFVSEGFLVIWAGAAGSDLDDGCPADRLRHENAAAGRQRQLGAAVGRLGQADLLSGQEPVDEELHDGLCLQDVTGRAGGVQHRAAAWIVDRAEQRRGRRVDDVPAVDQHRRAVAVQGAGRDEGVEGTRGRVPGGGYGIEARAAGRVRR